MAGTNININLGNIEESSKRREAYAKAAKKEQARSLGEWVKKHLDEVANYSSPSKRSSTKLTDL